MTTDSKLKIENLDHELFIEELGGTVGGQAAATSLAAHEGPDWSDTPPWSGPSPMSDDYADKFFQSLRESLLGAGLPPAEMSTMALGEE